MIIRSIRHKGLKRLVESDDGSGATQASIILLFLQDMSTESELSSVPSWKAHQLTGDRRGRWALHVTRNWRITFAIEDGTDIVGLDYEDYH